MYQFLVAFKILKDVESPSPVWKKSTGHLTFDVNMEFIRNARWVKDGHWNPDTETSSYALVVSCESIWIALTTSALKGVYVLANDIRNTYLQSPSSKKDFIICGLEFGLEHQVKLAMIVQTLYRGKFVGRNFWHHLKICMNHLGFESCLDYSNVWMRDYTHADGTKYYEYVLLNVNDCLVISNKAEYIFAKRDWTII